MTGRHPDFDELVGTDLPPGERERLLRVHELLVESGPPPEFAMSTPVVELRARRRGGVLVALAAAFVVAAFAIGFAVGDRSAGRETDFVVAMKGTSASPGASASVVVFEIDDAGNWPMELKVEGLPPASSGLAYELWLTRDDELTALCGYFRTDAGGSASVPMNAPYELEADDGWVVVEDGSETPLLTT
ncbi:MAG TPA: anti-sigma factor [Gaiellaceae bacterium]|nr:anti-sigma factor [Gaiellaceae bacterium]